MSATIVVELSPGTLIAAAAILGGALAWAIRTFGRLAETVAAMATRLEVMDERMSNWQALHEASCPAYRAYLAAPPTTAPPRRDPTVP